MTTTTQLVWLQHVEGGARHAFGEPLPEVIADQVRRGQLRYVDAPDEPLDVAERRAQLLAELATLDNLDTEEEDEQGDDEDSSDGDEDPDLSPSDVHACATCGAQVHRKGKRGPYPRQCDDCKASS